MRVWLISQAIICSDRMPPLSAGVIVLLVVLATFALAAVVRSEYIRRKKLPAVASGAPLSSASSAASSAPLSAERPLRQALPPRDEPEDPSVEMRSGPAPPSWAPIERQLAQLPLHQEAIDDDRRRLELEAMAQNARDREMEAGLRARAELRAERETQTLQEGRAAMRQQLDDQIARQQREASGGAGVSAGWSGVVRGVDGDRQLGSALEPQSPPPVVLTATAHRFPAGAAQQTWTETALAPGPAMLPPLTATAHRFPAAQQQTWTETALAPGPASGPPLTARRALGFHSLHGDPSLPYRARRRS